MNAKSRPNYSPSVIGRRETNMTYMKRRFLAVLALAGVGLGAATGLKDVAGRFSTSSVADKLAQPFAKDQAAIKAGKFAPGQVVKFTLPGGESANSIALQLAANDPYSAAATEIQNDIQAQDGDLSIKGEQAFLPASDIKTPHTPVTPEP